MKLEEALSAAMADIDKVLPLLANLAKDLEPLDGQLADEANERVREWSEAKTECAGPRVVVAAAGTTSSGKSTLLNALLGTRLLPMDAAEMSAGIVRIRHTSTPFWKWEQRPLLPSNRIYQGLQETMHATLQAREESETPIPGTQHMLTGPTLLGKELKLDSLCLEVVDLPGLRTVKDPHNRELITRMLTRALCVVVLDRTQLFEKEKHQALLEELSLIVKDLGGPELCIFVLNKSDVPNPGGRRLSDVIEDEEATIAKELGLDAVNLVPVSGLREFSRMELIHQLRHVDEGALADTLGRPDVATLIRDAARKALENADEAERRRLRTLMRAQQGASFGDPMSTSARNELAELVTTENPVTMQIRAKLETSGVSVVLYPLLADKLFALKAFLQRLDAFGEATKEELSAVRVNITNVIRTARAEHSEWVSNFARLDERELDQLVRTLRINLNKGLFTFVAEALCLDGKSVTSMKSHFRRHVGWGGDVEKVAECIVRLHGLGYGPRSIEDAVQLSVAKNSEVLPALEAARMELYRAVNKVTEKQLKQEIVRLVSDLVLSRSVELEGRLRSQWAKIANTAVQDGLTSLTRAPRTLSYPPSSERESPALLAIWFTRSHRLPVTGGKSKRALLSRKYSSRESFTAPSPTEMRLDWLEGVSGSREQLAGYAWKVACAELVHLSEPFFDAAKEMLGAAARGAAQDRENLQKLAQTQAQITEISSKIRDTIGIET